MDDAQSGRGRKSVMGQVARVDVCPCGTWKVSIGPTTLAIDRETAGDLCSTLAVALDLGRSDATDRLVVLETVESNPREN